MKRRWTVVSQWTRTFFFSLFWEGGKSEFGFTRLGLKLLDSRSDGLDSDGFDMCSYLRNKRCPRGELFLELLHVFLRVWMAAPRIGNQGLGI